MREGAPSSTGVLERVAVWPRSSPMTSGVEKQAAGGAECARSRSVRPPVADDIRCVARWLCTSGRRLPALGEGDREGDDDGGVVCSHEADDELEGEEDVLLASPLPVEGHPMVPWLFWLPGGKMAAAASSVIVAVVC